MSDKKPDKRPDKSDRLEKPAVPDHASHIKRLGGYLVEAGLLSPGQIDVALNDQKLTGMRFGDILVTRGWVKQQTIEYLMQKVIVPERQASLQRRKTQTHISPDQVNKASQSPSGAPKESRREVPITKPLPAVNSSGEDVSWVG
ncbi:hypothetical protein [Trichocoleus sp. FACHB-591]|uniref:hypothetical protein n=1 Tax=Trichocoleus sp. FACHB-591 TaxID=2692872 RepID=UPI001F54DB34|nr:hypothetical protein [Trichocoleus sp. FACHB-591]